MSAEHNKDAGAALIEASIILPVLILILIGILEVGGAFHDYLTVSYTTREASRVGSVSGNDIDADCNIANNIVDNIGTASLNRLVRFEIYQVNQTTGDPVPGTVNTWAFTGFDPYDCADWTVSESWPATARKTSFTPGSNLDILGVRVIYTHNWFTGFPPFTGSFDVDESTITRLEPESFE